jgi:hypothetical protein
VHQFVQAFSSLHSLDRFTQQQQRPHTMFSSVPAYQQSHFILPSA